MFDKVIYYLKRIVIGGVICLALPCSLAIIGTVPLIVMDGIHAWNFGDAMAGGLMTTMICVIMFFVGATFDYMWKNHGK